MITDRVASEALDLLHVDQFGLEQTDRLILETMIVRFGGGPVGVETLAASVGEDASTIEDVWEPYLIKNGFMARTPRGRVALRPAFEHLGYTWHEEEEGD